MNDGYSTVIEPSVRSAIFSFAPSFVQSVLLIIINTALRITMLVNHGASVVQPKNTQHQVTVGQMLEALGQNEMLL